jgi:lysozyme family protein
VLSRGSDPDAGHVGFLLGEAGNQIYLLGGNQSDAVTVAAFPKARLLGVRWPMQTESASDSDLFGESLAHVLEMEGGFTDDAYDPGGPTNRGITLAVYADWKGVPADACLKEELKHIPEEAVRAIYAARYWAPAGCAQLVPALAFFHFDTAVNHGVVGAIRLLQQAVGTDVDGEIGPLTLAAVARRTIDETLEAYADVRRARYRALPHFWRFGRGWLRRVDSTLARAREIAARSASSFPTQQKGPDDMATSATPTTKWWGNSVTIWGTLITALSTVLPALGPVIGIDITSELVQQLGTHIVEAVQAAGGLIGIVMTIYGRVRASQPLVQREMTLKL